LVVIGADGKPVRWGETGELVIGGVGMARYLDTAKDSAKFAPLPSLAWERAYRSGDLDRAEPDGKKIPKYFIPGVTGSGKFQKPRVSHGVEVNFPFFSRAPLCRPQ
jgi:hypothetical protein